MSPDDAQQDSPIEAYLDGLLVDLSAEPPRRARHLLAEAEGHLRDAAEASARTGMSQAEAEADAVARFGPSAALARAERDRRVTPLGVLARQAVTSAWFLGALGAIAVGLSGVVAAVLGAIGGKTFLADVPNRALTASDCSRWLSIYPHAASCHQAAISDWAAETVYYRLAAGLLGAVAMAVFVVARRGMRRRGRWAALPATVVDTVAATLFGASGAWLLLLGADAVVVSSGHGAGQWLSAAPVALGAAAVFAVRLLRDLRSPADAAVAPA